MKKILTVLMCTAIFSAPLCSCRHDTTINKVPDSEIHEASETSQADSETNQLDEDNNFKEDSTYYTGTFNEEVFEHIIQNISLKGIKVSMPCTFSDLSSKFKLNDSPYVDSEHSVTCYTFDCKDKQSGFIEYDSNKELTKEEQKTKKFYLLSIDPYISEVDDSEMYVAGLTTNDTYDMIKQTLGEPTDSSKLDGNGKGSVTYSINDNRMIIFSLRDNEIQSIMIINK